MADTVTPKVETKHTPGPWWMDGHNIRSATVKPDWMPKGIKIAEATAGAVGDAEWKANAALIAASPDLLEACKGAVLAWRQSVENTPVGKVVHPIWLDDVKLAIARAEGRQP